MGLNKLLTLSLLALRLLAPQGVDAAPAPAPAPQAPAPAPPAAGGSSSWWLSSIQRQGAPAFGAPGYKVFRNVRDYGAKGDGSTDDTAAINSAIADGNRCGLGCDSQTTTPALVYFPPGVYVVSKPVVQYYYTQLVGDLASPPTLKASAGFQGMAVVDSDPYTDQGASWWVNQNNFFRQVRNFVIDITALPITQGAGIHWQVAQATSLQNIVFNMRADRSEENAQKGIFMDNGSGGFMSDLTFNGGGFGAFFGSQQFTTRNLTFNGCNTAVYMQWNWAWSLQGVTIKDAVVGVDMTSGGAAGQNVGSVLLLDSVIANTQTGVLTSYNPASPQSNGTLVLDNVDMSTVQVAVASGANKQQVLAGSSKIVSWAQGRTPGAAAGGAGGGGRVGASKAVQSPQQAPTKPGVLLDAATGRVFTRSKPQYLDVPASQFLSVKAAGAKGDGKTDDTAAIQAVFDKCQGNQVVYFDHGAYIVSDTVRVPKNIKITGEVWPLIMAKGAAFQDQANPRPVFQVGQPGDVGGVEMSDLMFETVGPQPGAVMIEWNVEGRTAGAAAMWDVHVRIGGSAGTELELEQCAKNPNVTAPANPKCMGVFLMMHVARTGSVYLENTWFWVADHALEPAAHSQQIDIFSGRGLLVESSKPVWMFGTASEHSVLYNYQLSNASNVYMTMLQSETPYFQGNPDARTPFAANAKYNDPDFSKCSGPKCARSWGFRAVNSRDVFVYGAGLYSFFDNYAQQCVSANDCQDNMVSLEGSSVQMYGLSTKASVNMLTVNGQSAALDSDNRSTFCATLALFSTAGGGGTTTPAQ
ncbi:uncharacterized protein E0L32_007025 [Thyridium curvatum]|uniref:Rhamnogalacturonase A/B/Epimerase-like pectate lyase domain-containing protein n=1 Tax=Thyridium curvatum TaxID=1093900 RepID=A0A507B6B8_9PEZI|nr:uncharacterized protein E0L32_007025 [Thyridium curvatum]TPX12378.1 hypothetical protein E0L32_007025 [Thyridium curvatum]